MDRTAEAQVRRDFAAWQRDRDPRARERLLERYLPLAHSLARRYASTREPMDDLIQIASYGLLGAIDRFDAERTTSFSSFAVPTILGELRRHLRDHSWAIHVPRGAQERALAVEDAVRQITGGARRDPTVADLAAHLRWSMEDVLEALHAGAGRRSSSLDAPLGGDEEHGTLVDTLGGDDAGYDRVEERLSVGSGLPRYAREVVRLRFVEDLTQVEIGERLGMSQMTVSRVLRAALAQLRATYEPAAPRGAAVARPRCAG